MGKVYTFMNKDNKNTKVRTELVQQYLDDGWSIGNWNQEELNRKSGNGVKKFNNKLREKGEYEDYKNIRAKKISETLKDFWGTVDDQYKIDREIKKLNSRERWTDQQRLIYHNKMSQSAINNRKTISSEEYKRRSIKSTQTKKQNNTFAVSSFEKICYNALLQQYGEDDVVREYDSDTRYQHKCDFYIKSLDLFIELNIHPSHGSHPYNNKDENDVSLLESLKQSDDSWDNMIASVCGEIGM